MSYKRISPIPVTEGGTNATTFATNSGTVIFNGTALVTLASTGTSGKALVSAGAGVAPAYGTVPVVGGGTNATSFATTNGTVIFDGTRLVTLASAGTSGQVLISAGAGTPPAYGTLSVPGGGSGVTSHTAYALIAGGTTSTGPVQSLASVGTSGQILTSNGAGQLPTWQTASGSSITIEGNTGGPIVSGSFTFSGGSTGLSFNGVGTTETLAFAGITANGGTVNLATDNTASIINIGTGAGLKTTTIGSTTSGSVSTFQSAATGSMSINSNGGALSMASGTGALNISTDAVNTTILIGAASATKDITIGGSANSTTNIQSGNGGINIINNAGDLNISNDPSASTIRIATGVANKTLTIGSTSGASLTTIRGGSSGMDLSTVNGTFRITTGTGQVGISDDSTVTTVNIGTGSAAKTVTLGSVASTSTTAVNSGSGGMTLTTANSSFNVNTGVGTINIADTNSPSTVNIATGASTGVKTLIMGSVNVGSQTIVRSGSNGLFLSSDVGVTSICDDNSNNTVNFGTGSTTGVKMVTLGSLNGTSTTTIRAGSGGIQSGTLNITGNVNLPSTNSAGTQGVINVNSARTFHAYGAGNIFVGGNAGNFTLTTGSAINNAGMGINTLQSLTTGQANAAIGSGSAVSLSTGSFNTSSGVTAYSALTTGNGNTGIGYSVGTGIVTGGFNTLIGYFAGFNLTTGTENSNIFLASDGVNGDSHTIRIGEQGSGQRQVDKAFMAGIYPTTVGGSGIPMIIDNTGQMGTLASALRYKKDVADMGTYSSFIYNLRPVTFKFKSDATNTVMGGLIAEEVALVKDTLVSYNKDGETQSVKYHDLVVLLLNELKKLKTQYDTTKAEHDTMKADLISIKAKVNQLLTLNLLPLL